MSLSHVRVCFVSLGAGLVVEINVRVCGCLNGLCVC